MSATAVLAPGLPLRGATVAIFSPSSPGLADYPEAAARARTALSRAIAATVVVPPAAAARTGYWAMGAQEAADELHRLALDRTVDLVMMAVGGFNSNRLLPYLDWDLLRDHPKLYCGYSDATALLAALHAKSRLVTFYGPALLPQFTGRDEPFDETVQALVSVLRHSSGRLRLPAFSAWTSERLDWTRSGEPPARQRAAASGWRSWRPGRAIGTLYGGNVETLNALVGTPWAPDLDAAILFVEATGAEAHLPRFERALTHLRQAGWFDRVVALLVGRCPDAQPVAGTALQDVVLRVTSGAHFPVVGEMDFGHTDPMLTLPIGATVEVAADPERCELILAAPAVSRARA